MTTFKIGLEIHVYLKLENKTKLFCNCKIDRDANPNTTICEVCTGQPGARPKAPNQEAIEKTLKIALLFGCKVNKRILFQRKHYDWPDLPKGYQITASGSYGMPVGVEGKFLGVGIKQLHLEEDPARWDPETGEVDYNRSGYPLVEIVTHPDFENEEQVEEWLRSLLLLLSYMKVVDRGGGIKCDVNISKEPDFVRIEIKNVNSISSIIEAIKYEKSRLLKESPKIQETRAWTGNKTVFMRSKEHAIDYRFIPDPDLPLVLVDDSLLEKLKEELPELPEQKFEKMINSGVDEINASILSRDIVLAELWEFMVSKGVNAKDAAVWIRMELLRALNQEEKYSDELAASFENLLKVYQLYSNKEITDKVEKQLLNSLVLEDFDPVKYVEENNLKSIKDSSLIEQYCDQVIEQFPKAVQDYKSGNEKVINFLKGQVMKLSKGKADPNLVENILREKLK